MRYKTISTKRVVTQNAIRAAHSIPSCGLKAMTRLGFHNIALGFYK